MILEQGQTQELEDAIGEAYNPDQLEMMLRSRLERRLFDIVTGGPFPKQVATVIAAAEQQGWTVALVKAAHEYVPGAARLKRFYEGFQPVIAEAEVNPYESYFLRGGRLFLDRKRLRDKLKKLAAPTGSRVLVIDGPPATGKTYSVNLIQYVSQHPTRGGFWVHHFDLGDPAGRGPDELAYDVVLRFAGDPSSMPPKGQASKEKWASRLAVWIANQVNQLKVVRYLVFDSFSKFVVPKPTLDMIRMLTVLAEGEFQHVLHVVLLSYGEPLPPQINDYVQRDSTTVISITEAVEMVTNVAKARAIPVETASVTVAVQNIWADYPEGTPERFSRVMTALAELIQEVILID